MSGVRVIVIAVEKQ